MYMKGRGYLYPSRSFCVALYSVVSVGLSLCV